MKLSLEYKATILGVISSFVALALSFAASELFQPATGASAARGDSLAVPPADTLAHKGYQLFMMNCAHCHGADARGDEGPNLHGVTKSDTRIASLIKDGKEGEMPKFGAKLTDTDVQALITFVRSLKD